MPTEISTLSEFVEWTEEFRDGQYLFRGVSKCSYKIEPSAAIELKPDSDYAYYKRGMLWLHLQDWEKAKTDLTTAKSIGIDITVRFHSDYTNVENFEQAIGIQLPPDIAEMLTQQ